MCRAGGRRCDTKWDDAHRERYNARRRIARNGQKAEAARAGGDDAQVAYYESLVQSATVVEKELDESIKAHENEPGADKSSEPDVSYRSGHSAPEDDGYSKPITQLTDGFFGDDVYEHPDWYGTSDDETMAQLKKVRDDPSATVTVYRAVPNGHREINQGDWVTLSREYAEEHSYDLEGEGADGAIVSMEVPSSQVFTDGNDLAEYGFTGPSTSFDGERDATDNSNGSITPNSDIGGDGESERCPQCGRWVSSSHDCPQERELESLRQDSAAWRDSWTDEEDDAFDTYGGIQHEEINAKLRAGTPLTVEEATVVRGLDSALARAPLADHERTLYRSFSLSEQRGDAPVDEWVETNLPQGETVAFDAYTSVTPDHAVSEEFSGAMSEYTDAGVVMEVRTSQSGYTGDSAESEVLLQRGSQFTVVSNEESFEDNGKKFRKVIVQEVSSEPEPLPHPLASRAAGPEEIEFVRNPVSSTTHMVDRDFGQDVEPSGRYITKSSGFVPDGWESGSVRFEKPLYIHFGESGVYADEDNWKRRLSGYYGGKSGKALSKAVRADGYDGIVTHDKHGTSEIVDLTSVR